MLLSSIAYLLGGWSCVGGSALLAATLPLLLEERSWCLLEEPLWPLSVSLFTECFKWGILPEDVVSYYGFINIIEVPLYLEKVYFEGVSYYLSYYY